MKKTKLLIWAFLGGMLFTSLFLAPKLIEAQEEKKLIPLELDGSKWAIEETLVGKGGKTSSAADVLNFEKKQFFSEVFSKNGYEPTNYSVSANEDGTTKFGTMQNKNEETVYWEGRVNGDAIDGTINVYSKKVKGIKEEYYFNGTRLSGDLKPKEMPKPTKDGPVEIPPSLSTPPPPAAEDVVPPIIENEEIQEGMEDVVEPVGNLEEPQLIENK